MKFLLFSPNTPFCASIASKPVAAVITAAVAVNIPGKVAHQLPVLPDSLVIAFSKYIIDVA
jgi:hypothetical protein